MIDYEKLKIAHKLVYEHAQSQNETSTITLVYYGSSEFEYYKWNSYSFGDWEYKDIDNLIAKIRELSAPKPKYEAGQEVWYCNYHSIKGLIRCEKAVSINLVDALFGEKEYRVSTESIDLPERFFYPSKEALIDAQIEYWKGLKHESIIPFEDDAIRFNICATCKKQMADVPDHCKCPDKLIKSNNYSEYKLEKVCEHETDGQGIYNAIHMPGHESVPLGFRCKKCLEFYR